MATWIVHLRLTEEFIQIIPLIATIIPTEKALRNNFGKNGIRITK